MSQTTMYHDDEGAVPIDLPPDPSRRFWVTTACALGGVAGVATAVPFVSTFAPSAKARAAGAPVEVDVSGIPAGQMITVEWRGKPVWLLHRTEAQLESLSQDTSLLADPHSKRAGFTPKYAENEHRSRKKELFVCVGICTHLGCSPHHQEGIGHVPSPGGPTLPPISINGFLCPCHGSKFDLAGRVFANVPAPDNLQVPPYQYLSDTRVIIGVDEDNKA